MTPGKFSVAYTKNYYIGQRVEFRNYLPWYKRLWRFLTRKKWNSAKVIEIDHETGFITVDNIDFTESE